MLLFLVSCRAGDILVVESVEGIDGKDGKNGESCSVERVENGALITCPNDAIGVFDGEDGEDGIDGANAVLEIIDPCGNNEGHFDEVILRLSTGDLLAYFESGSKRFLSIIDPGNYRTTDAQRCYFTVTEDLEVIWD
jgi:hypothetical protein